MFVGGLPPDIDEGKPGFAHADTCADALINIVLFRESGYLSLCAIVLFITIRTSASICSICKHWRTSSWVMTGVWMCVRRV